MSKRSHASLRRTSPDLTKLCPGSASHWFHRIHATATDAPTLQKLLPVRAGSRSGQLTAKRLRPRKLEKNGRLTKTPKRLANLTGSLTDRPTFRVAKHQVVFTRDSRANLFFANGKTRLKTSAKKLVIIWDSWDDQGSSYHRLGI